MSDAHIRLGETKTTRSGRVITFPDLRGSRYDKRLQDIEAWLLHHAILEATALHDDFMLSQFERMRPPIWEAKPKGKPRRYAMSTDDIQTLNTYLFDPDLQLPRADSVVWNLNRPYTR